MQITENVHAMKIPFKVKTKFGTLNRFVYSYLIKGEGIVLIDTGVVSSEVMIEDYMEELGLKLEEISLIILTHSHPDHIGSVAAIKEISNCQVAAHIGEKAWIEDVDLQAKERPVPNFHSLVGDSVDIDILLKDGDEIEIEEGLTLKILHTPGHSEGSISIVIKEEGIIFTGDAVPIKGDLPIYDDYHKSKESILKIKEIKNINCLLSSWDNPKTDDEIFLTLDNALDYLDTINNAVKKVYDNVKFEVDPLKFCKMVLKELNIPENGANPIVVRSLENNLRYLKKEDK